MSPACTITLFKQTIGGILGGCIAPEHGVRRRDEVQIVVIVEHRIDALHLILLDVGMVDVGGDLVPVGRRAIVADQHVDVRRHVDEMAGGGSDRIELLCRGKRPFGMRRRLDGMDVEMVRARMVWIARQHRFRSATISSVPSAGWWSSVQSFHGLSSSGSRHRASPHRDRPDSAPTARPSPSRSPERAD